MELKKGKYILKCQDPYTYLFMDGKDSKGPVVYTASKTDTQMFQSAMQEVEFAFNDPDGNFPNVTLTPVGGEGEEVWRQTWLDASAVDWIIASGCRLLVSDIYESPRLEGVFLRLFAAGISTVCMPKGLARLGGAARISVTFLPVEGMVQMPCRIIAEEED